MLRLSVKRARAYPVGPSLNGGPRKTRRWLVTLQATLAMALAISLVLPTVDFLLYRGRTHRGVAAGAAGLSGKTPEALAAALANVAADVGTRTVRFEWRGRTLAASLAELGWRPDLRAMAAAALAVGRSGDLWENVRARARSWFRTIRVPWMYGWDAAALDRVAARWEGVVAIPAREGAVWVEDMLVRTRAPEPGVQIDRARLQALSAAAIDRPQTPPRPLPLTAVAPLTAVEDVREAARAVRALIAAPVQIRLGAQDVTLSEADLAGLIEVRVAGSAQDGRLEVTFSPARVRVLLSPYAAAAASTHTDARFVVDGPTISIEPSVPGRVFDPALAAADVLRIARRPDRSGEVAMASVPAEFTEEEAAALGIVEEIASFTTYHEPGEPRVINIHLAADMLHGAIVEPGKRFSLNEHLGQRTPDRGFVLAPAIINGRFGQAYGGGVSQLATTLFNAAFFGGYPFLEYRAHSYYISRYPMGREATLSWGDPDLAFRNDTDAAILIATEYTDTSITVRIFGTRTGRTVAATDPVIVGRGTYGYTVLVQRIIEEDGKEVLKEDFLTYYRYGSA